MDVEKLDISETTVLCLVLKIARRVGVIYTQDIVLDAFQDMWDQAALKITIFPAATSKTNINKHVQTVIMVKSARTNAVKTVMCPNNVTRLQVDVKTGVNRAGPPQPVSRNVLMEPLDKTVAENVDIV